ncbi:superoxide dismutase [Mn] [Candidatus Pantoea edessiphila]|uniref:Superoxide dismutase n=1 Tax=Candidatus Pantoea edessiphila TaxID=2044610 RepID=A0A2P5SXB7_9GAMM|nr:Fe-Mn family superoxide dismutase [Candidatus Pantoea edessiphila]MBK4775830.1 superoxide dismutase [Mn] [Pantoea sp. Edef]PPI86981.1 superoxide dismutase [Mn] [Candidatus Pantoea edessiphila]
MSYSLPQLSYSYDALEPFFDKKTMEIHHTKHHQTYINNANIALQGTEFAELPVEDLITKLHELPVSIRGTIINNVGGHFNHSFFWNTLKPNSILTGNLKHAIENKFNNILKFQEEFEKIALSRFGSGWVWLIKENNQLSIVSTANQDNPLMGKLISGVSGYPIIGLDVWEHAYYLKYQNRRIDYIKSFWNIVDWSKAGERFELQI